MRRLGIPAAIAASLCLTPGPAAAGFEEGLEAYQAGDMQTAVAEWRAASDAGHVGAAFLLANMYRKGIGVPVTHVEAIRYYAMAAEAGHPDAMVAIADYYRTGNEEAELEANPAEALNWLDAAALKAHAPAQYKLGIMHRAGEGVRPDSSEGIRWLLLAAEKNYAPAQAELARIYFTGDRTPQNEAKAVMYARLASESVRPSDRDAVFEIVNEIVPEASAEARLEAEGLVRTWKAEHLPQ